MTNIAQIIVDAYQYNNLIAISAVPTAAEQAKALRYLNRIFRSVFGNELGDNYTTVNVERNGISGYFDFNNKYLTAPNHIPHNSRLVLNLENPITVYLPTTPNDGERLSVQDISGNLSTNNLTVKANGRLIEGSDTLVLNTDDTNTEWFYRADLGNWLKVTDLENEDTFPLPVEFEEFFITLLAIRLGASEDVDLNNQLQFVMKDIGRKFKARYQQKQFVGSELGLVRTTRTGTWPWSEFGVYGDRFDHG